MYLAPLNYDRFFERNFKNVATAKRFFEDLLKREIKEFEPLPRKGKITDDAAFVEFDYHCLIDGEYHILDMQQWYKGDVVKRFYFYDCNNTSLQAPKIKPVNVPMSNGIVYRTKNYDQLRPATTIVWMVDDTLGFEDDMIVYAPFPEVVNDFIQNEALWTTTNRKELLKNRQKILKLLNNRQKNLDFLPQNRLIFLFQKNVVKNKNDALIFKWCEFAALTKNKNNVASDFKKFLNDPIFATMIEDLRTHKMSEGDFEYIEDYDTYITGVRNYDEKIRTEALREAHEIAKKEQEAKLRLEKKYIIRNMRMKGFSVELIADIAGMQTSDVYVFFKELDKGE
jgi:hypothetical protein